jgi:hypothetical protein
MRVLSSPRRRRRLCAAGLVLVALGTAAAVMLAFPAPEPLPPDRLTAGPPTEVERPVKVTPAMRRSIARTLERFVPAAVGRRDPQLAWSLAGPGLREGTTRAEWLDGELPVFPFPARRTAYDEWKAAYAYSDRVGFDLMLMPRPETRRGPLAVSVDMTRSGKRWLVDSWYVTAVFTGPDERPWVAGAPDYEAGGYGADAAYRRPKFAQARLSTAWFAVPGGLLALGLAGLAGFAVRGVRRNRRARAAYASQGGGERPRLVSGSRTS